jgi:RNA polymerase sigma-70 factor (ECF subfamily)
MSEPLFSTATDQELVQLARGQPTAFTLLYRRHVARVYRYLLWRVGHVHDAQDLTTLTFMAALEQFTHYRGQGPFSSWLLGIARHKASDHLRRRPADTSLEVVADLATTDPAPDEVAVEHFQRDEILHALHRLTPERAEAISLRFFAELTTAETAVVMGKDEAAVKMLVHRGVQDLRRLLMTHLEVKP